MLLSTNCAVLSLLTLLVVSSISNASPFRSLDYAPDSLSLFDADPEMFYNATEIIRERGYQAEEHSIVTTDQYILTINRIKPGKMKPANGKVAVLQHGLLDSAHTWINNPSNQSLGFLLADEGYDVWIPNSRGSTYSQKHVHLTVKNKTFWDFSWDEMSHFDLPASIDFILNMTGVQQVYYIGHSQGTEIFFAHINDYPESQRRIKAMVALAPVAYLGNVESPIHFIAPFCQSLGSLIEWIGEGEFMPSNKLIKFLAMSLCEKDEVPAVCSNIIYLLAGYDKANTNKTRLPIYLAHTPAGTSVQNIIHYCQSMHTGRFQKFDFGPDENLIRYGQPSPPAYGLQRISIPMAVFWGGKDWLASPPDVKHTLEELGNTVKINRFFPHYNHLDFVWGMDAAAKIYQPLIKFLAEN